MILNLCIIATVDLNQRHQSHSIGVQRSQFFRIFDIIIFWFAVAIFDLMHNVEAIHGLY